VIDEHTHLTYLLASTVFLSDSYSTVYKEHASWVMT